MQSLRPGEPGTRRQPKAAVTTSGNRRQEQVSTAFLIMTKGTSLPDLSRTDSPIRILHPRENHDC